MNPPRTGFAKNIPGWREIAFFQEWNKLAEIILIKYAMVGENGKYDLEMENFWPSF